jgi:VanZ family protein
VLFSPDPGGPAGPTGSDKVVHLTLFALLAGTASWRFAGRPVPLLVALYAGLSEVVQALFLAHRSGDVRDLAADLLGVALGLWVVSRSVPRSV